MAFEYDFLRFQYILLHRTVNSMQFDASAQTAEIRTLSSSSTTPHITGDMASSRWQDVITIDNVNEPRK